MGHRLGVGVTVSATPTPVEAFYLLAFRQIGVTLGSFSRPAQRKNIPCLGNSSLLMLKIATINALATKVGSNNLGVIENTLGLFKISFGVLNFSAGLKGKSAVVKYHR